MPTLKEYTTPYQEVTYAPVSKKNHGWHKVERLVVDRWIGIHGHIPSAVRWEIITPHRVSFYNLSYVQARFEELKQMWFNEIMFSSDPTEIVSNKHYKEIIDLGYQVVPFLLADMKNNHTHWFTALRLIIGVNPIKKEHYGDIPNMINDWLEWSKNNLFVE